MSCERTLAISELLDHELSGPDALDAVDHLLECAECAQLYRQGRQLDRALLLGEAAGATPAVPSPELWGRIRAASAPPAPEASTWRLPVAARRAAAAALIVLGGLVGWQLAQVREGDGALARGLDRTGKGAAETMDEDRFADLARELIASDSRYQEAMVEVLEMVRSAAPAEASTAESSWRAEDLRELEREGEPLGSGSRVPMMPMILRP